MKTYAEVLADRYDLEYTESVDAAGMHRSAVEVPGFRFVLTRTFDRSPLPLRFVMLNPSTADGLVDDPTIRRCTSFARTLGFGGIVVVNLYPIRCTDPTFLAPMLARIQGAAHMLALNNDFIADVLDFASAGTVVAAWGADPNARRPAAALARRHTGLSCLGTTKSGAPRHPLYLRSDALAPWTPR